jgi:ParB family chromosome partitioning protein
MSVRATEEAVVLARNEKHPGRPRQARSRPGPTAGMTELATRLSDRFDTTVKVEMGARKGRLVVEFGSAEDLERIAGLIERG